MAPILRVLNNPLVSHWLCKLRNKETTPAVFRQALELISNAVLLETGIEFAQNLIPIETPVGPTEGKMLAPKIAIIPILRAGLGMASSILSWLPDANVYHLGACRNHTSLLPEFYYNKLPLELSEHHCLVIDPMLATGGSASETIRILLRAGVTKISFLGILGSKQGVQKIHREFPDVSINIAALDDELNQIGYIIPGLGDAGDRFFNT